MKLGLQAVFRSYKAVNLLNKILIQAHCGLPSLDEEHISVQGLVQFLKLQ